MLDKGTPVFATAIRMRSQVVRTKFAVVIEFLRVLKEKRRAEIRTFRAVKPADCFVAGFMRQRFAVLVRFVSQICKVLRYGIVSRHVFQFGNGFVQFGIFIDMIDSLMEN